MKKRTAIIATAVALALTGLACGNPYEGRSGDQSPTVTDGTVVQERREGSYSDPSYDVCVGPSGSKCEWVYLGYGKLARRAYNRCDIGAEFPACRGNQGQG